MSQQQLVSALDLMRRMPPADLTDNLTDLLDLTPDLTEDLLSTVDQPLQKAKDGSGRSYLLCDYNRDMDSYRSPWTNEYDPPLDDGAVPSDRLRSLEKVSNDVFDAYREQYYQGGDSSVYMWEVDDDGGDDFAACVLFKKDVDELQRGLARGGWDSIHVIEARKKSSKGGDPCVYKLTSTVMLTMQSEGTGSMHLAGSLTRQRETEAKAVDDNAHVVNMGTMIEDMELQIREALTSIYFGKTREVINQLRKLQGCDLDNQRKEMQLGIGAALKKRAQAQ